MYVDIWRFPEIGLPPKIIHFDGIFHYKPSSYGGTSMTMEPPKKNHRFLGAQIPDPGVKSPCDLDLNLKPIFRSQGEVIMSTLD